MAYTPAPLLRLRLPLFFHVFPCRSAYGTNMCRWPEVQKMPMTTEKNNLAALLTPGDKADLETSGHQLLHALVLGGSAVSAWPVAWRGEGDLPAEAQKRAAKIRQAVAAAQTAQETLFRWCGFPTGMTRVPPSILCRLISSTHVTDAARQLPCTNARATPAVTRGLRAVSAVSSDMWRTPRRRVRHPCRDGANPGCFRSARPRHTILRRRAMCSKKWGWHVP